MSNTSIPKTSDNSPFNKCLKNNTEGENLLEKNIRFQIGKNVITQGEEGIRFYIVKSGKVDILLF